MGLPPRVAQALFVGAEAKFALTMTSIPSESPPRHRPLLDLVSTDDDTRRRRVRISHFAFGPQLGVCVVGEERESSIMPRQTHSCDLELLTHM